jgi:oxygen-independent coproporphyrinogen-3 oxidase
MVARYEPVQAYVGALLREIRSVSSRVRDKCQVSHIHWGGGSPNILAPNDISKLAGILRHSFDILDDAEFAVEFDPRYLFEPQVRAFMEAGLNRVSLGVQDFNESVQKAINRRQSYEMTERTVKMFRDAEINSVNIDLVYGLPHQSSDSVERTIDQVLSLEPDRIALFGYAHLPSKIAHQRLIDTDALPGAVERFAQSNRAADRIVNAGYNRIGFDHFAKPDDSLVQCNIRRNFQGYTSDEASVLIGIGATAIGQLPRGYVQNAVPTGEYMRRVENGGIATVRGFELSQGDSARAYVINRLMCTSIFLPIRYGLGSPNMPTCWWKRLRMLLKLTSTAWLRKRRMASLSPIVAVRSSDQYAPTSMPIWAKVKHGIRQAFKHRPLAFGNTARKDEHFTYGKSIGTL